MIFVPKLLQPASNKILAAFLEYLEDLSSQKVHTYLHEYSFSSWYSHDRVTNWKMMAQSVLHSALFKENSGQSNRRMSSNCWCLLALAAPFLVLQLGPVLGISEERRERLYFEYTRKLGHDLANPNTYEIRTLSNFPFFVAIFWSGLPNLSNL